jgi:hypothetical protein
MVLERYPDPIIREATNPLTGIQRTCKFPPSIAEMVEFIDELKRRANFQSDWDANVAKQNAEYDKFERQAKAENIERRKAAVARLKADLAKVGMHILRDQQPQSRETMCGPISKEDWDALPDAPPRPDAIARKRVTWQQAEQLRAKGRTTNARDLVGFRRFSDEDLRAIYATPEKTASDPE